MPYDLWRYEMKIKLNNIKNKMKHFFDKVLKSNKDANLNSRIKDEAELKKMREHTKMY